MSKQYLAQHTIDDAHRIDIYALAVTPTQILSASGESTIKIHTTTDPSFPIAQVLKGAHKLGCHHIATSLDGSRAVSVGFGGEAKVWKFEDGIWKSHLEINEGKKKNAGELWAVALSGEGRYMAGTMSDGRISVWDLDESSNGAKMIKGYDTRGGFGMSIDLSPDGRFTASGHETGHIYVFSNSTGRMLHSLPGLVKPVRSVSFSPGGKLLAAAGDAKIIALYDYVSGEQVANLSGHAAWITSLSWSHTGEYLLSGALDGKVKVWSVELRTCVATHSETEKALWSVKWLPKREGEGMRSERFVVAGGNRSIAVYREATGG